MSIDAGWPELSRRLDRLLDLPETERQAELVRLEGDDAALAARLRALLAHRDAASRDGFLAAPACAPGAADMPRIGTVLGAWTLAEPIGEGGMGVVWRAVRSDGRFEGEAAVKLLQRGAFDRAAVERFRREGAILARLQHPGIARLHDAGLDERGVPYLVLELVHGQRIDHHADGRCLPVRARLALVLQVLDAVAAAHAQLVIHRDLKPSNILVDDSGRTRLLDFGIARLLPGAEGDATVLTREGLFALTPRYAAPEQFDGAGPAGGGSAGGLSTATDVYAVGVVLHELLTGVHPSGGTDSGIVQCLQAAQRGPERLASDWAGRDLPGVEPAVERARQRAATPRSLARALRGDLDAILVKALQPRAADRYPSATAFADDLRRHLDLRPVHARPGALGYRLGRQLRRHAWAVASVAAVVVALVGGALTTAWQARLARTEADRANAVQRFVLDIFRANSQRQADPQRARQTTARELLDLGAERLEHALAGNAEARAQITETLAQMHSELGLTERAAELRKRGVALAEQLHGPGSPELVAALEAWSADLNHLGRLDEREQALARAQAIVSAGPDRPSPQRSALYRLQSEFAQSRNAAEAVRLADLALRDAERLDDRELLYLALVAAGSARLQVDELEAGRTLLERAVAVADACGCPHPSVTLRGRVVLAEAQNRLLEAAAAERSLRRALEDSVRSNGPHHLDTLQVSLRLTHALVNLGRIDEAVALLEPLRPVVDGPRGADEFSGPHLLHALGEALSLQGHHVEAVATLRRAIELRDRSRPGTPFSAWLQETLAQVLVRAGRIDEAQRAAEEAERIERATGTAPGTARWKGVASIFVQLHLARGEYDAARRRAGEVPATTVGERRPTAFDIDLGLYLAQIELETGHDDAAAQRLSVVRSILAVGQRGAELPLLEARRRLLCGRWALAHAPAEAGTHLDRALDLRRRHLGRNVMALDEVNRWLARAGTAQAPADPAGPC